MATSADRIALEIQSLSDAEKLRLVDIILSDLDKTSGRTHLPLFAPG
jgi:hypothetical protein